MTDAQRQKRRRRKLRREAWEAEKAAKESKKRSEEVRPGRYRKKAGMVSEERGGGRRAGPLWRSLYYRPPFPGEVDELARQIDEFIAQSKDGLTIDDVRAAIDRRWPPSG